jgi:hypothetical protein
MIDAAKRFYLERHGEDRWFEEVEAAYYEAIFARAERERIRRTTPPDYDKLTPSDLQERVKSALVGRT